MSDTQIRIEVNGQTHELSIPGHWSLLDALREYEKDKGLKEAMGQEFSSAYIKMKMQEWNSFVSHFSEWERANTLDI